METGKCLLAQVVFSLFVILLSYSFVKAETINCTPIPSLPWTITTQGIHCLTSDLTTAMTYGNAVEIQTNNVVIDLNGHKLGGLAAGPGTLTIGIYAYRRQNITIKNGTIRGFQYGVHLEDITPYTTSQGHVIEDIRADMNTIYGIEVFGRGNIIRNNQVVDTGGATFHNYAYGIMVWGPGNRVLSNDVYETKEQSAGVAYGILVAGGDGSVVLNNRVGNQAFGAGSSVGIALASSANVFVKSNTVSKMGWGILFDNSPGLYGDNLASGCTTSFSGGTPAGSTNFSN